MRMIFLSWGQLCFRRTIKRRSSQTWTVNSEKKEEGRREMILDITFTLVFDIVGIRKIMDGNMSFEG